MDALSAMRGPQSSVFISSAFVITSGHMNFFQHPMKVNVAKAARKSGKTK